MLHCVVVFLVAMLGDAPGDARSTEASAQVEWRHDQTFAFRDGEIQHESLVADGVRVWGFRRATYARGERIVIQRTHTPPAWPEQIDPLTAQVVRRTATTNCYWGTACGVLQPARHEREVVYRGPYPDELETIRLVGDPVQQPFVHQASLARYVDHTHSKCVGIIPLQRPRVLRSEDHASFTASSDVVGAYIKLLLTFLN